MNIVTYSELRNNLKKVMDASADQHEPTIIKRPHGENMVLLSLSDYESMKETAYLLGSEVNAAHLRKSIRSIKKGKLVRKELKDLKEK